MRSRLRVLRDSNERRSQRAIIVGDGGTDVITGSAGSDLIVLGNGDNTINLSCGTDLIVGVSQGANTIEIDDSVFKSAANGSIAGTTYYISGAYDGKAKFGLSLKDGFKWAASRAMQDFR